MTEGKDYCSRLAGCRNGSDLYRLRQTPEMIASAAVQEDVDVIGLSILSGAHNTLAPQLMNLLREKGMADVHCLAGRNDSDGGHTRPEAGRHCGNIFFPEHPHRIL